MTAYAILRSISHFSSLRNRELFPSGDARWQKWADVTSREFQENESTKEFLIEAYAVMLVLVGKVFLPLNKVNCCQ